MSDRVDDQLVADAWRQPVGDGARVSSIMLDLETLGVGVNAVILSIGAVAFDERGDGVVGEFHVGVDIDSCLERGMVVDGSTIRWWMDVEQAAARDALWALRRVAIVDALVAFGEWYALVGGVEVWGNGAAFDNAMIGNAYRACGLVRPWGHREDMCYRTVRRRHAGVAKPVVDGVMHDALYDARVQALHLQAINRSIAAR